MLAKETMDNETPRKISQHDDDDDDAGAENPATTTTTPATSSSSADVTANTTGTTSSIFMNEETAVHPSIFSTSTVAAQIAQFSPCIVAVEVWCLDDNETGLLVLEPGGTWTSPALFVGEDGTTCSGISLREKDGSAATTIPPGVDLAGTLWTAAAGARKGRRMSTFQGRARTRTNASSSDPLHWHSLEGLLQDPDTAKGEQGQKEEGVSSNNRMEKYRALGIERVAGVPFEQNGYQGIVVFMATGSSNDDAHDGRDDDNDGDHAYLELAEHDTFLHQVTNLLSTTVAMQKTKLELIKKSTAIRNSSNKVVQAIRKCGACCSCCKPAPCCVACSKKIKTVLHKAKGGGMPVPQGMSTPQAMFTWIGCFLSLLVLSCFQYVLANRSDFLLFMGPLGALAMLQYGMTQAPAAQPRNAVLAQAVAGPIAIAIGKIPGFPQWLRVSLGAATTSATISRLGIAHPPAAAMTVLYLSPGNNQFANYGLTLISVVISVVMATIINNFSDKRQYPTYWTGPLVKKLLRKLRASGYCRRKEKHEDYGADEEEKEHP